METARCEPRFIHRSPHRALARGDWRASQRAGARDPAAVSGRQAEGTRALRQRLIAKKPIPAAASAAAPPPAASGTLLPPLRLPPPPVPAPPAGVNPVTVGPEDRVAEGTTAAGVVAESLGASARGRGRGRRGVCVHVHSGSARASWGAQSGGGACTRTWESGPAWWRGVVDGGVVGGGVLVQSALADGLLADVGRGHRRRLSGTAEQHRRADGQERNAKHGRSREPPRMFEHIQDCH